VDIGIVAVASGANFVTGGKLKTFGVGGLTRLTALPNAPTVIEETGFKEFTGYTWNVLVAAKGTPPDVIEKLNAALNQISAKPAVIEKLAGVGLRTLPGDVKTIADFVAKEAASYRRVIELTGVKRE
jgi:tripartite-type tricarboxylate transporter receptor subunit TctC